MGDMRRIRREKEINQYELARAAGISQAMVSLIERGFRDPNTGVKRKIARALRCQVNELFPANNE